MSAKKVAGRLAMVAGACLAYGTFVEPHLYKVRRERVPILPVGATPIRVLQISDSHLLASNRDRLRFIRSLCGLEPDFVVCTGDMLAHGEAIEPLRYALGRLLDIPGVFVFGSSDYEKASSRNPLKYLVSHERKSKEPDGSIPTHLLDEALSTGKWKNLTNADETFTIRGTKLEFRGTDDAHIDHDDWAAVAGKRKRGVKALIGVTHAPYRRVLDAAVEDGCDLILCGHTHGGQVCVPGFGALTTNCDLPISQAKGLSKWQADGKEAYLNVSAGFGQNPFTPFRFACPPEVSLLTLVAR
ncbi:MAG: metallophosphoesterase [Propionibacteriaceae bacterium]|jgi:predicted MPP superfamily phosphohydrolase|nr:metallophosphoesterase [Propionibacteriaceae bacterium]